MTDATSPLSDDDRRAAIERLHAANEEGRMDLAELVARTERVQQAKTGQDLAAITADLEAPPAHRSAEAEPPREPSRPAWIVTLFGDVSRSGSWRVGESVVPISLFGDVDLDLSKAALASGVVTITAVTPFGDVEVLVPAGVEVDVGGFTVFGNKRVRVEEAASGSAPVVKVRAYTIFGSVRVRSV